MDNIIFGHLDGDLHRTVQFLQRRNVNVVIRNERDFNAIRIHEAKEKEKAKENVAPSSKGNACPVAQNAQVISKAALAQRVRRERERNEKKCSAYQLGQRLRRERERSGECIQLNRRRRACMERGTNTTKDTQSATKRTMITHSSTSLAPQRNWPTPTPFLQEIRNVGVVNRDECDLHAIHVREAKEMEKANPMFKGKEKATYSGKGKEIACSPRYPDAAKFRRMPLQFSRDLDILFSDAAATGECAYTPSSRVMPDTDDTTEEFHTPHDAATNDDVDLEVVHPSELNKKSPSNTDASSNKSKTKKKVSGAILLNKTLDRIVNVVESSSTTSTSSATSTQTLSRYPSIAECLVKLESIPGVSPDDDMYVWAARLFLRDKHRECFMTLPTDKVRLRFLKLEIEMEKISTGYRG